MKTTIFILLLFLCQPAFNQNIYKNSIDNGGASVSHIDIQMVYTIGEVNVQEITIGNMSISEGFIGPNVISTPNVAPSIISINVPQDPIALGSLTTVTVEFDDNNLESATINWGNETGVRDGTIEGNTVIWTYQYPSTGVYELSLVLTDLAGVSVETTYQYLVIYDPLGGFVTGGGWINSLPGAYIPDPNLAGKASFGFVAKYKKGANVPDGNTEFQFKAGDLNFTSTLYDWLVIAGSKAKFKGEGTINNLGEYGFMLSAIDGDLKDDQDRFRIKIWNKADESIVYDNEHITDELSDPSTAIGGGSIVIHTKDKLKSASMTDPIVQLNVYPNPFTASATIELEVDKSSTVLVNVYNIKGEFIDRLYEGAMEKHERYNIEFKPVGLESGIYILEFIVEEDAVYTRRLIYRK